MNSSCYIHFFFATNVVILSAKCNYSAFCSALSTNLLFIGKPFGNVTFSINYDTISSLFCMYNFDSNYT